MPLTYASALRQFQRRMRAAVTDLRREISSRQTELRGLRDEEVRLTMLAEPVALLSSFARHSAGSARVNSRQVIVNPKKFRTSDLQRIKALKYKRPSEIYASAGMTMGSSNERSAECF